MRGAAVGQLAAGLLALLLSLLRPGSIRAETLLLPAGALPPWDGGALPLWVQSARVHGGDQPVYSAPFQIQERRGTAVQDALLPIFGARRGPGCTGLWLHVGPQAWMCQRDVELSERPPLSPHHRAGPLPADGLPLRYYFATEDGSFAYAQLSEADVGEPVMQLEPGFAVAIVQEQALAGQRYGRTNQGLWVPMRDFARARSFTFEGESIDRVAEGVLEFAWVVVDHAIVHVRRGGHVFAPTPSRRARFERVAWLEEAQSFSGSYVRIDQQHWLRTSDVRHPTLAPPPDEAHADAGERWIDIELASQTLVAYEGRRPVFATLVSTGKSATPGHPFETPVGIHRIWVKLLTSVMDNLENEHAGRYYRIEDVPYVQYFAKAVGMHAAFWHRAFGHVRSHGCVNLAPLDAQRLFGWTGPDLPAGWNAALPTAYDRGTLIRVR